MTAVHHVPEGCGIPSAVLERFTAGDLDPNLRRGVLSHLLKGCPSCRKVLDGLERPTRRTIPPDGGGISIDVRSLAKALEPRIARAIRHRADAVRTVESLLNLPVAEQRDIALRASFCQTRPFVAALLEAAWNALLDDPQRALGMTELAVEIADALPPEDGGVEGLEDLRARAWGRLANCRRALSDFEGAHQALRSARAHLRNGSGEPLERAEVLYMEASLLRDQKRFPPALERLEQAGAIYRALGERSLEGRTYLAEAGIFSYDGRDEEAVIAAQKAIELVDLDRHPKLALAARHNLVVALARLERYQEALEVMVVFRDQYERHGDRTSKLRRDWTEGMILRGLGRFDEAEQRWQRTIEGFAETGLPYEVAEVALELATLYLETGKLTEIRRLAVDAARIFSGLRLDSAAMAAWMVFQEAAERQTLSVQLLGSLASFYRAAKGRPGLAYRG